MFSLRNIVQRARPAVISSWAAPKAVVVPVLAAQRMFSASARLADDYGEQRGGRYNNNNNNNNGAAGRSRPATDALNNFVSKTATSIEASRSEKRVVQINNVPYEARWEDIFRVFGYYGEIERIKFPKPGFCYVHYVDVSSVSKAVTALNNTYFHSRRIFVNEPEHAYVSKTPFYRQYDPCETVYMGNLPYDLKEDELKKIIEPLGPTVDVRVPTHPSTGLLRGFAHIQFSTVEAAKEAAEKLQGTEIRGRSVIINFAAGKKNSPSASSAVDTAKSLGDYLFKESARDEAAEAAKATESAESTESAEQAQTETKETL